MFKRKVRESLNQASVFQGRFPSFSVCFVGLHGSGLFVFFGKKNPRPKTPPWSWWKKTLGCFFFPKQNMPSLGVASLWETLSSTAGILFGAHLDTFGSFEKSTSRRKFEDEKTQNMSPPSDMSKCLSKGMV